MVVRSAAAGGPEAMVLLAEFAAGLRVTMGRTSSWGDVTGE